MKKYSNYKTIEEVFIESTVRKYRHPIFIAEVKLINNEVSNFVPLKYIKEQDWKIGEEDNVKVLDSFNEFSYHLGRCFMHFKIMVNKELQINTILSKNNVDLLVLNTAIEINDYKDLIKLR